MSALLRARLIEIEKELRSYDYPGWEVQRYQDEEQIRIHAVLESDRTLTEAEFLLLLDAGDERPDSAECFYTDYNSDREVTISGDFELVLEIFRQMLNEQFQVWTGSLQPLTPLFTRATAEMETDFSPL
ncbi:hypothetical protein [Synechococcus elongatus]|uniref:Uncharacterized protein n=2 Tax=Synechococcus elongatus TaxID=32046 RepID=Q31MC0_SYNE7|nr:hypothetical protein [Synechococcus elongatus]ABB57799.1 conserved hypothetical protein [Synechococcus elongatus PCC 7942 = FACHB-805]AJD57715.1 hypothetical protein M744_07635 [Synechococcus elongatus UTEX 2973]MBD2586515.1 hypothetical protein [Synechococcus elongatus FACHB-242]MBD2687589.1 hypothetical protein [Synechococcus elongatus FACHB-1061]MBD2706702.1 hypothetical protein [Synechococcus elongatus PCC 7942 = FACHB-805]